MHFEVSIRIPRSAVAPHIMLSCLSKSDSKTLPKAACMSLVKRLEPTHNDQAVVTSPHCALYVS